MNESNKKKNRMIALDRDGTLNLDEEGYVHKVEDFKLLPGVMEGMKKLNKLDFLFFIITNQSGIGRGYYTEEQMHEYNGVLAAEFKKEGIEFQRIYFCPHDKDANCDCRKPNTKFIDKAVQEFNIDPKQSWMVGDHASDVELGKRAGTKTIHVLTGHGYQEKEQKRVAELGPDFIAKDFTEVADFILENEQNE